MMKRLGIVQWFGVLDIALIGWVSIVSLRAGKFPFYSDLRESWKIAESFGGVSTALLALIPHVLLGSVLLTGILLLRKNKFGGYLALLQAPFRIMFVIQPSLFFLTLSAGIGWVYWVQIAVVLAFELLKLSVIWAWLRQGRGRPMLFTE